MTEFSAFYYQIYDLENVMVRGHKSDSKTV